MKKFKGKAIYTPNGKAREYSQWACNFYIGCSNGCTYCYLKKGRGAKVLGGNKPTLKKCFKNETHAMKIFIDEVHKNRVELKTHGLFFSFTTDPMLPETVDLTIEAITLCNMYEIPVKILTKRTDQLYKLDPNNDWDLSKVAIGFTFTGYDDLEPNTSPNNDRIAWIKRLNCEGFKTFASIEPIIDFDTSGKICEEIQDFCDLINVGLMSGHTYNDKAALNLFLYTIHFLRAKVYIKESLQKLAGITNADSDNFVEKYYNIFD